MTELFNLFTKAVEGYISKVTWKGAVFGYQLLGDKFFLLVEIFFIVLC